MKPTTALIDGDAIIFKAGFANEKVENGEKVKVNPEHYAFSTCKDLLDKILKVTQCNKYKIFIDSREGDNFRKNVATIEEYKGNRKEKKRPALEFPLRNYLFQHWGAIRVSGAEVDDALGIAQDKENGTTIIVSNDKDLDMIPGWHYDIDVGRKRIFNGKETYLKQYKTKALYYVKDPGFLSLREVNGRKILTGAGQLWFAAQILLGDSCDNIPHIKGTGPVLVYNILKEAKTFESAIRMCYAYYKENGISADKFKEIAKLLWIKREQNGIIFPKRWLT